MLTQGWRPRDVFAQIVSDVTTALQTMSVADIAMRRMYRLVDIGELETSRTLEKTTRICTKWYSAIPDKISEEWVGDGRWNCVPAYIKVVRDRSKGGSQTTKIPRIET